jgi:predicted lactoylglutathione lyase
MAYISLVTLGVQDVARATTFYQALGWRTSTYSVDGVVSFLSGGTVVLALYAADALAADSSTQARASYAINVYTPEEVDKTMHAAEAAGATVASPAQRADWGGYVGYFTDGDGHLWEVAHNPDFPLGDDGLIYLPGLEQYAEAQREETESQITGFIAGADDNEGQTVARLATDVVERMRSAHAGIASVLADQPNNVVVATMLELSQRMRESAPTDGDHWLTAAASTVVSSLIRPGGG